MRKLYSLFIILFLSLSAYSQNVASVFITDAEIAWLDNEIQELETAYSDMQEALATEDNKIIASKKTALIKSINRLSTNSNITRQKIDTELNPPTKRPNADLDTPKDYYYNKKKKTEGLQELKLTVNNWETIQANALELKALKDKISANNYYFHSRFVESSDNLQMVAQMLELAKTSNSIIQRSQVD